MTYKLDKTREFLPINFAILTISDTRTKETDKSGDLLEKVIKTSGQMIVKRLIVPEDHGLISRILVDWSSQEKIEAIISTGGTGLTGRDVSVEAHRAVYDKEIDLFCNRIKSYNPLTNEKLKKMADDIPRVAGDILPNEKLDCIAYGCTSGTVSYTHLTLPTKA
mgnify:CR=1 FL=1